MSDGIGSPKERAEIDRLGRRMALPDLALAVRQPWAWAIIHGGKPLENRTVGAIKFMVPLLGLRAIHASKGMTRDEYESGRDFINEQGLICPAPAELKRGGIIGTVNVTGVVRDSASPWFFGPRALVLEDPQPCEFVPAIGRRRHAGCCPRPSKKPATSRL